MTRTVRGERAAPKEAKKRASSSTASGTDILATMRSEKFAWRSRASLAGDTRTDAHTRTNRLNPPHRRASG